ncbi:MAG TPA: CoA transferase [Deltaproteobacteria bacterium]|nr:CoA transferase [Deltaproteobacteria bacterium]
MSGPLAGIRVLDLATPLAEATGRVLADLGAEVIKVEPPGGCESRHAPPLIEPERSDPGRPAPDPEASLFWQAFGLGKRSVVLDLEDPEDRDRFLALVRSADILIESFTPGDMAARHLGPEQLIELNPALLYLSVSPFGQTGPYARHPATDLTLAAAGGILNLQGDGDRVPIPVGIPETAHLGAVQAAADVLMALYHRNRTGRGQHLDTSIQAAVLWSLLFVTDYAAIGEDPPGFDDSRAERTGSQNIIPGLPLPVVEPCKDGFVVMTLVLGAQGAHGFNAVMNWIGEQGGLDADLMEIDWLTWIEQIQQGSLPIETARRGLDQFLAFLRTMTKAEIHARAVEQKWLIAPINLAPDLLADPQLEARGFWTEVAGRKMPGPFARLSRTPIVYQRAAPRLGQDQDLVGSTDRIPLAPIVADADHPTGGADPDGRSDRTGRRTPRREQIFEGLRVADFSWIAAGPLVTKDLANLGATVLRVETENRIDTLRFLPPWIGPPGTTTGHTAANMNQSKLGIAIDFTTEAGLAVAHRMVEWADVVVENFTPGTAERLKLDYETLRGINPEIVMLYTCMRGQTGPERKHTGFGVQGAALSGLAGVTGWPDRKPSTPWGAYTDFISPRFSLAALCAALHHRDRTGEGQCIDLSQIEASIHHLTPTLLDHQVSGRVVDRAGLDSDWGCPHGVYRSSETERFVAIEARTPDHWRALAKTVPTLAILGGAELEELGARLAIREEIDERLAAWCSDQISFEAAKRLREAGVPAYAVLRATDFHSDAQLDARGFFIELEHTGFGKSIFDGAVTIFSETPARPTRAGPLIGEHTFEVMRDILGYSEEEISEIAATGALT